MTVKTLQRECLIFLRITKDYKRAETSKKRLTLKADCTSFKFDEGCLLNTFFPQFLSRYHMLSDSATRRRRSFFYQARGFTSFTPQLIALLMDVTSLWETTFTRVP